VRRGDLLGQPARELALVVLGEPAESQRGADLRAVVLHRAPGPLVAGQLGRVDPDLAGDVADRGRRQLPAVAGKRPSISKYFNINAKPRRVDPRL
jgi:hypothetical protein